MSSQPAVQVAAPTDIKAQVERILSDHAARFLDSHGGAVHVALVNHGEVELRFEGACSACPAVAATFYSKVAPLVRAVPGVTGVKTPNVHISEAAVRRLLTISTKRPGSVAT